MPGGGVSASMTTRLRSSAVIARRRRCRVPSSRSGRATAQRRGCTSLRGSSASERPRLRGVVGEHGGVVHDEGARQDARVLADAELRIPVGSCTACGLRARLRAEALDPCGAGASVPMYQRTFSRSTSGVSKRLTSPAARSSLQLGERIGLPVVDGVEQVDVAPHGERLVAARALDAVGHAEVVQAERAAPSGMKRSVGCCASSQSTAAKRSVPAAQSLGFGCTERAARRRRDRRARPARARGQRRARAARRRRAAPPARRRRRRRARSARTRGASRRPPAAQAAVAREHDARRRRRRRRKRARPTAPTARRVPRARSQPRDPFGGEDRQREQIHHQRARRAAQRAVERHVVEEEAMHRRAVAERQQDAEERDARRAPTAPAAVGRGRAAPAAPSARPRTSRPSPSG